MIKHYAEDIIFMKKIIMANGNITASEIGLGCMRIANLDKNEVNNLINTALDCGINFFDHADIYGKGKSEEIFSESISLTPSLREKIIIQSKCAIRPGMYDYSKEHILDSVDGILKRLKTDYLDILLLHRPDTLMEPEEVSEAFEKLYTEGKVRNFGVSNHNSMQIELLNKYLKNKITIDIYGPSSGDGKDVLASYISAHNVADIVTVNAPVFGKEKADVINNYDVFIQTSRSEGMPMGILEALSYGMPVIATQGTRLMEQIAEHNCGYPAGNNSESIAVALKTAFESKTEWETKGRNARNLIATKYEWEIVGYAAIDSYTKLIKK